MIQLNLLPDVKIAYIKARAQKRLVILGSFVIGGATLAVFVLLFVYVHVVQTTSSNNLSNDIHSNARELTGTKDLNKILTVQNQLGSLDAIHDQKPSTERLAQYIAKTTPDSVKISQFEVDFAAKTITSTGKTGTLDQVNKYVDTLKTATYTTKTNKKPTKAFSDVVLASFSRGDQDTSFTVKFNFDSEIFNSKQEITLSVTTQNTDGSTSTDKTNDNAFDSGGTQ